MTALPRTYSDTLDVRVTDTSLRDGSHAKRHQFTETARALDRRRARRRRDAGHRGDPRRRPRRLVLQLRALARRRAHPDEGRRRRGHQRQDRRAHAAGAGNQGRHQGHRGDRRVDRAGRHPLHGGRHLRAALRPGPRDRPRDRRVPDDGPHVVARRPGQAGPHHGRCRLPVRLRGRLRRSHDPGGRVGSSGGRRGRVGRRRPGRLPRPREPVAVAGQHHRRHAGRGRAGRRFDPPVRRRLGQHQL